MNIRDRAHRAVIYFSLGSNLGDRKGNLEEAKRLMSEQMGTVERVSRIYKSSPWGFSSVHPFYNFCLSLRSRMEPFDLMEKALQIEKEMGRISMKGGYADRLIDIDLLLYDALLLNQPGLILPHPRMEMRRFVLVPLAEIAPDQIHPVSGLTVNEILERCQDPSEVNPV